MRAARWGTGAIVTLLLVVATIWGIGSRLPVHHQGSVSKTLPVDADSVWVRISDVAAWPSWRALLVDVISPGSVRVEERGETVRYRIERPGERTLVTEIDTPGLPYGGRWTWSVIPVGDGTATVTIVEDGEVYDPFFRFFGRFVFGHDSSIRDVLDQLEASFDSSVPESR